MFKITVNTTRSAMFCMVAACFASTAQADVGSIGGVPATVSDAILATTQAANLQRGIVTPLSAAAPAGIAPVGATVTTAQNVRLWDEVIPPAPSPKPTQASTESPIQTRTVIASVPAAPATSSPSLPSVAGASVSNLPAVSNASVSTSSVASPRIVPPSLSTLSAGLQATSLRMNTSFVRVGR